MKLGLFILTPLLFKNGILLNACDRCTCCKGGASRCKYYDSTSDYCLDGCIDRYYGRRCVHACMNNCLSCSGSQVCTTCSDGYYGLYCDKCPHNCQTCSNKNSCTKCSDGYYGAFCEKCPDKCVTCSSQNYCTSCEDGFYNGKQYDNNVDDYYFDCRHQCQDNCKSCTSYNTCTECISGFYNGKQNSTHESNNCQQQCPTECKSCASYNVCTECVDGKHNNISTNCSESCNQDCKACTSYDNCTSCKSGKYGSSCQFDCGTGCDNGECDINNGSCICISNFQSDKCDECVDGKYGSKCNISCPLGCADNLCGAFGGCYSCKTGFSGSMCGQCVPGKYGKDCDMLCPTNCQNNSCQSNGECYSCKAMFSGNMCDECVPGNYGTDCDIPCPTGCKNSLCKINGDCYQCITGFSGNNCSECEDGKYGTGCNITCSANCANNSCKSNGDCYRCKAGFTGTKCDTCIDRNYGDDCNEDCPKTCTVCTSETNCTACEHQHWGSRCQPCPRNCLNCSSDQMCLSCKSGFYGQICQEHCHTKCRNGLCDEQNGSCINGCIDGFYEDMCDQKCSPNCVRSKCGMRSGECLHGCKTGFKGTSCAEAIPLTGSDGDNKIVIIGAAAGGGLFVVIVVIVAVLLIRKRRRRDNSKSNDMAEINEKTDNTTVRYSAVIADSLPIEQTDPDVVYAVPDKPKKNKDTVQASNADTSTKTVNNDKPLAMNENTADSSHYETHSHNDDIISQQNDTKPNIAAIAPFVHDNNAVRNSVARTSALQKTVEYSDETEFEIEEDIDSLTISSTASRGVCVAPHTTDSEAADTYYNVTAVRKRKINLDKLPDFVSKKTKVHFNEEFEQLPPGLIKPCKDSQRRENLSKNRYKGIYPYDATRILLKGCGSDYINASYIDGYNKRKAYIASIGPTYKYMGDMSAFWIMVWQEKVGKIVMLTKLEEGGAPKCDQYWPEKDFSLLYANIQVTCQSEETYADYTVRAFIVQKDSEKRCIIQVHFMAWPDKGTPDDVTSLIEFRQKVISIKTELEGPILVHCSAGIGRTGTYIALDSLTEEGEAEGGVDIFAFVRNMREQRVNMVQTAEQYQYLHNALVHTLTFDSKAVEASKFGEYLTTHTDDHLVEKFHKLQASVEQRSDDEKEAVKKNEALKNKNRVGADIPGDHGRPKLYLDRQLGSEDYINAVYVNSYQTINRYLVAQTPLPDTVVDFLTLIVQEKVSCIVSMEPGLVDDKTVGAYTSDNQSVKIGTFTVVSEQRKGTDQYALRSLHISYKGKFGKEVVTIPHIQFTQWNDNKSIPEDPAKFIKFVKEVELKNGGNDAKGPILVHCLTGAEKSGLFCVVSILLEKTEIDHEISVVNTVRQIKHRRHMSIPNKDQYIFCHKCVNEYLHTFDSYSNFGLKT